MADIKPSDFSLRPASLADAPFVALVMMEAIGAQLMEEGIMPEEHIVNICRRTDTLYSYKNAVIAELDGKPIGCVIAYNGKGYHDVKTHTFSLIRDKLSFNPNTMDDETREGEYYLDSIAILPAYRNKGYGRQIIAYAVKCAQEQSLLPVLACSPENEKAYQLYRSLGFEEDGRLFIFGEDYLRMTCKGLAPNQGS